MRASLNISLPQAMKKWVEGQAAAGGYATTSEYIRQLLRAEQQRLVRQLIEDNLHASLDAGESTPMSKNDWERIRRGGRKPIARRMRKS
jgi:antitoxin ParD1/3/4